MTHEWLQLLTEALAVETPDRPMVMTLATLSRNGSPRARSVICRAIDDDGTIWITSDSRSRKNGQIKTDRRVEAVFWLPTRRLQFRIRGEARLIPATHPRAMKLWTSLSDSTRAMFTWPAPGESRGDSDDAFATILSVDALAPDSFQAIAIHARLVESLDLNEHPQRRQRWRRKNGWRAETLNP
jgi:pyridoxamine 5'-phosphate oxidase